VIRVKDTAAFDEEDEYLNRYYAFHEYDGKIRRLTEYYKFHRDIARMFMLPTTTTLNKYHDKKRRIFYIQITKMLKEKEGKKDTPPPSN
jgi:predicted amidophosphoribosyltransferase